MIPQSKFQNPITTNNRVFYYNKRVKTDIAYLEFKNFDEIYRWFLDNANKEKELFVKISRQKPEKCIDILSYYDAVKAALCFGWIDSTLRNINGVLIQRFSPRKKNSHWTETNINRCKELDRNGLMKEEGKKVCPLWNS